MSKPTAPMLDERRLCTVGPGLRLACELRGQPQNRPTVVLEAGGGAIASAWCWIQERLAAHGRVIAYDRAGLGDSQGQPRHCDAAASAERLDALLAALGEDGPCLLVGHSLGGLLAHYYAATRPQRVAGLVLIDPTPDSPALFSARQRQLLPPYRWLLRLSATLARLGPLRLLLPVPKPQGPLPVELTRAARAAARNPQHLRTFAAELGSLAQIQNQARSQPLPPELPLLILGADRRRPPARTALVETANPDDAVQRRRLALAAAQAQGRSLRIAGTSHLSLLLDRRHAQLVAEQILQFAATLGGSAWADR